MVVNDARRTTAERESRRARGADLGEANSAFLGFHRLLGGKKAVRFDLIFERMLFHAAGVATSLGIRTPDDR